MKRTTHRTLSDPDIELYTKLMDEDPFEALRKVWIPWCEDNQVTASEAIESLKAMNIALSNQDEEIIIGLIKEKLS